MKKIILLSFLFISTNVFSMNKKNTEFNLNIESVVEKNQLHQSARTCFIAMYDYDENGQQVGDPTFYFFNTIGDLDCAGSFALMLQFYQIMTNY